MINLFISRLAWWLPAGMGLAFILASAPTSATPSIGENGGVFFPESANGSNQLVTFIGKTTLPNVYSVPLSSSSAKVRMIVSHNDVSVGTKFMTPKFQGVMAAPNESEITAKVLRIEQSTEFPDKWFLELEILAIQNITGGTFAQVGDRVKAFTIASRPNFSANNMITAKAEFLGDAQGGSFRLTNIQIFKGK